MLSALALAVFCLIDNTPVQVQGQEQDPDLSYFREMRLEGVDTGEPHLLIQVRSSPLDKPKLSPLNAWQFPYLAAGYARDELGESFNLRLQVFDQFNSGKAELAVRLLLRLWDFNRHRLNLDHATSFHLRTVQIYLAFGGEPGAEQKFMQDPEVFNERNEPVRVNNIYVYDITSIDDPLEFAREIAHEYGHAILPPLGNGFEKPEAWANGDVGERIYLMWLLEGMKSKKLEPKDVMGASLKQLQLFYDKVTLPDLMRVATKGPNEELLKERGEDSFNELLGLASYAAAIMPHKMFGRAIALPNSADPESFLEAVVEAATEKPDWTITIPEGLANQAIWVPIKKGNVSGAKELQRKGDWVKIQPTAVKITVTNEPEDKS